jgi:hypothetical protein
MPANFDDVDETCGFPVDVHQTGFIIVIQWVAADGSFTLVGTGNWGFSHHPDTDEPGIFLLSGRFVFSIDAQGNESLSSVGHVVDLCAQLAA